MKRNCFWNVFLLAGMVVIVLLLNSGAFATNRVVVIPMSSLNDANLQPINIRQGVTILGVTGIVRIGYGCRYDPATSNWGWSLSACNEDCTYTNQCDNKCSALNDVIKAEVLSGIICNGNGGL